MENFAFSNEKRGYRYGFGMIAGFTGAATFPLEKNKA
jgi:hypothetical protein